MEKECLMIENNVLETQFESHRSHMRGVAYRILGSQSEAEDAVQEAWLRLNRTDAENLDNLGGWLTTVVARICLDMLRSRKAKREDDMDTGAAEAASHDKGPALEDEALLADSVGLALLVVLEKLTPAERIAFVLHDMFDFAFEEIAPIVDRTESGTRQLASRARRRVRGTPEPTEEAAPRRQVVEAFLSASRNGDFEGLMAVLDPDVVFHPDVAAAALGSTTDFQGSTAVANMFKGRARNAEPVLINGGPGLVVAPNGRLLLVLALTITESKVSRVDAIADPEHLKKLELSVFME